MTAFSCRSDIIRAPGLARPPSHTEVSWPRPTKGSELGSGTIPRRTHSLNCPWCRFKSVWKKTHTQTYTGSLAFFKITTTRMHTTTRRTSYMVSDRDVQLPNVIFQSTLQCASFGKWNERAVRCLLQMIDSTLLSTIDFSSFYVLLCHFRPRDVLRGIFHLFFPRVMRTDAQDEIWMKLSPRKTLLGLKCENKTDKLKWSISNVTHALPLSHDERVCGEGRPSGCNQSAGTISCWSASTTGRRFGEIAVEPPITHCSSACNEWRTKHRRQLNHWHSWNNRQIIYVSTETSIYWLDLSLLVQVFDNKFRLLSSFSLVALCSKLVSSCSI